MQANLVITSAATLNPHGFGIGPFVQGRTDAPLRATAFEPRYAGQVPALRVPDYNARKLLETRTISHLDRLTLHICIALDLLYKSIGLGSAEHRQAAFDGDRVSFVCGSSGPLQSIFNIDLQTVEAPSYLQPSLIPNLVFNSPASYAAIRQGIRGSCITLTEGDTSSLQAFAVAAAQLGNERCDLALVGGAEEATAAYALYRATLAAIPGQAERPIAEGATVFGLERAEHAARAGRASMAGVFGCSHVFSPGDVQAGIAACLNKLRRQAGKALDEVGVVCAEPSVDLSGSALGATRRVSFGARLGETGAMYGTLAVLDVLSRTDIVPGEHVLLLQVSREGSCAALLLQKHRNLEA